MLQTELKRLEDEGREFLTDYRYAELDDIAKMNANAYMRGMVDGRRLEALRTGKGADGAKLETA